jgi:uncharacterized protein (TIGR04255 family)
VLGVQFSQLPLQAAHIGLYWNQVKSRFPAVEQKVPLQPVQEVFGAPVIAGDDSPFIVAQEPVTPRSWFISKEDTDLIQLQPDRFIVNWRKRSDDNTYPRYEAVRDAFVREFEVFKKFAMAEDLGELEVGQCEITYVNQIRKEGLWDGFGEASEVVTWLKPSEPGFLPAPEEVRSAIRFVISDGQKPIGRLRVTISPAMLRKNNEEFLKMELTVRGQPESSQTPALLGFFDLGREWIVRGFAELTTEKMQRTWGRIQ